MLRKIGIEGMSCEHCVRAATGALEAIEGISDVEVSLEGKCATFTAGENVTDACIAAALDEEGFEAVFA